MCGAVIAGDGTWLVQTAWPGWVFWAAGVAVFGVAFGLRARRWGCSGRAFAGVFAAGCAGVLVGAATASSLAAYGVAVVGSLWVVGRRSGAAWGYMADLAAPAALLGAATARLGCFFRGCDFGVPTGGEC